MELLPYGDDDLWLVEALETDPRVMAELGGAWPAAEIPRIHRLRLDHVARGDWYLKVVPEEAGRPVGTIGVWRGEFNGEAISETGWTLLPEYQGRGYASRALRLLLERAAADGRWGEIHAFPGVTNVPSNALCRTSGFELAEEVDVDYGGRKLHCNHWVWRGKS